MSALALPELKRHLVARYRAERWRRLRRHALVAIVLLLIGGFAGFQAQIAFRVAIEGPLSPATISAAERRALELIRPTGFSWTSVLSAEQVAVRLAASPDAASLFGMLDSLPLPAGASSGGWLSQPSGGRIGRSAAIGMIARVIAEQAPDRQVALALLLADLASAPTETREMMTWVAALPQQERLRLRSLNSGPLMTSSGRAAILALAALPIDQIQQCQDSALIAPQDWSRLQPWLNARNSQLSAFRQLAHLSESQLSRIAAVAMAYTGPGQGFADAPYPCLDRPGNHWARHGRSFLTCTVALH